MLQIRSRRQQAFRATVAAAGREAPAGRFDARSFGEMV